MTATILLLTLAIGGPLLAIKLSDALNSAQLSQLRADRNFDELQEVVDSFLVEVSESDELLRGTPGTQQLQRRLLAMARDYFQQFIQQNQDDATLLELGRAHIRLADVQLTLGEHAKSKESYEKSIQLLTLFSNQNQ